MGNTRQGSFSVNSATTTNTKALKNVSRDVCNLIENRPMHSFARQMASDDCNRFMTLNLAKRKPIFKNYIHNNASILRKEAQTQKLQEITDHERKEFSYLDKISQKASSAMDRSAKTGPLNTLTSLMKQQTGVYKPSVGYV